MPSTSMLVPGSVIVAVLCFAQLNRSLKNTRSSLATIPAHVHSGSHSGNSPFKARTDWGMTSKLKYIIYISKIYGLWCTGNLQEMSAQSAPFPFTFSRKQSDGRPKPAQSIDCVQFSEVSSCEKGPIMPNHAQFGPILTSLVRVRMNRSNPTRSREPTITADAQDARLGIVAEHHHIAVLASTVGIQGAKAESMRRSQAF